MEEKQGEVEIPEEEAIETTEEPIQEPVTEIPEEKPRKRKAGKIIKRIFLGIGITLLSLILIIVSTFLFIFYSPWTHELRDRYVLMTYNTSNSWLATWFFSQKTIDRIFENNGSIEPEGDVDTSIIMPPQSTANPDDESEETPQEPEKEFKTSDKYPGTVVYDDGEVQIVQFSGKTSYGKWTARMLQVKDPSRVTLGVTNRLGNKDNPSGEPGHGQLLPDICASNNAFCGINGGGFVDVSGVGTGGIPQGVVIKDGVYTKYTSEFVDKIIGFTEDNILVIGDYTEEEAKELKIRDAMSWREPVLLLLNGELVEYKGLAGGYDPRSAIGQCADGTVLLLAVDGGIRGMDGVDFAMVADIMQSYGAVNAANIDGGTSSCMALNGEIISTVCNPAIAKRGRYLATAWIVLNEQEVAS